MKKLKNTRKEILFSELGALLQSGLDFSHAFELLISCEKERQGRTILQEFYSNIIAGESLAGAMEVSGAFDELDYGVVRVGEETGKLDNSLVFLSEYYARKMRQEKAVKSAVSYPIVVLFTALAVMVFMLMVVVPMFEEVYVRMGGELPAVTAAIIAVADKFPAFLKILFTAAVPLAAIMYLYRNRTGYKRAKGRLLLAVPLVGGFVRKHNVSRFCKLLNLLLASGVPVINSLRLLSGIVTFQPFRDTFADLETGLKNGLSLGGCLEKYPAIYDKKFTALVRVGEETNRLPQMLLREGEAIESELDRKMKQMSSMIEPLLILVIGALVALILISMYLPMFRLGGIMY